MKTEKENLTEVDRLRHNYLIQRRSFIKAGLLMPTENELEYEKLFLFKKNNMETNVDCLNKIVHDKNKSLVNFYFASYDDKYSFITGNQLFDIQNFIRKKIGNTNIGHLDIRHPKNTWIVFTRDGHTYRVPNGSKIGNLYPDEEYSIISGLGQGFNEYFDVFNHLRKEYWNLPILYRLLEE